MEDVDRQAVLAAFCSQDARERLSVLADDVVLHGPAVGKPYVGIMQSKVVVTAVANVLRDVNFYRVVCCGDEAAMLFTARADDQQIDGAEYVHFNAAGAIDEIRVMIRPLKGLQKLFDQMAVELPKAMATWGVTPEQMKPSTVEPTGTSRR